MFDTLVVVVVVVVVLIRLAECDSKMHSTRSKRMQNGVVAAVGTVMNSRVAHSLIASSHRSVVVVVVVVVERDPNCCNYDFDCIGWFPKNASGDGISFDPRSTPTTFARELDSIR